MKYTLIISFLLLLAYSCKKQQPQMNAAQNACDCIEETTAEFKIYEVLAIGGPAEWTSETDTTYAERNVRFIPKEDDAEYTWYIGSEIVNTKILGRYFSLAQGGQDIPVTLVVKKKPNAICFPNDDGYDSITKTFHVANYKYNYLNPDTTFIEGKYRLYDANNSDSIDITIDLFYQYLQTGGYGVRVINLKNVSDTISIDPSVSFRQLKFNFYLVGDFRVNLDGQVTFDFVDKTVNPYKTYALKGRKL
jgi:hypothetical protein